jgi:ribosomal protein S18 acetylase RimI-like enzyme
LDPHIKRCTTPLNLRYNLIAMAIDGYTVRELGARDGQDFRNLRLTALSEMPEAFGTSLEEERRKPLRMYNRELGQSAKSRDDFMLGIYVDGDEDVGLVAVLGFSRQKRLKARHKGLFWGMYVCEEHRRKGVGDGLLAEALDRVRALRGLEVLQLNVVTANAPAIELYEKVGFRSFGIEEKAFKLGGEYHDIHHMSFDLL